MTIKWQPDMFYDASVFIRGIYYRCFAKIYCFLDLYSYLPLLWSFILQSNMYIYLIQQKKLAIVDISGTDSKH